MRSGDIDDINFSGFTVWFVETATEPGRRYQANIKLKGSDGWHIQHGRTAEEAIDAVVKGVMRGERIRDPDPPAEQARRRIAAAADPEDHERDGGRDAWKPRVPVRVDEDEAHRPIERKRREPTRTLFDEHVGHQERKRR